MYRFARYRWYRRLVGGLWLHSMSCGWFPVTDAQLQEYMREMPRYITGIEDNTHDDAVLHGVLISVAIVCVVIVADVFQIEKRWNTRTGIEWRRTRPLE